MIPSQVQAMQQMKLVNTGQPGDPALSQAGWEAFVDALPFPPHVAELPSFPAARRRLRRQRGCCLVPLGNTCTVVTLQEARELVERAKLKTPVLTT